MTQDLGTELPPGSPLHSALNNALIDPNLLSDVDTAKVWRRDGEGIATYTLGLPDGAVAVEVPTQAERGLVGMVARWIVERIQTHSKFPNGS